MSDRDEGAWTDRRVRRRRRAVWSAILGAVVTVLGLAGLVLTEPVAGSSPTQPRVWAIGALFGGATIVAASLMARASALSDQQPRRPPRPSWLLLVAAVMGFAALISTATSGFEDPQELVSPGLLTVYPLALYAYLYWRFKRATAAE